MMQTAAILWHVSLLAPPDKKGLALGIVGLVRILPVIFFSIAGGVVADASDRRRVLFTTQSLQAIFAGLLAAITISQHASLASVYAISAITAAIGAFDGPARQSFVPNLVPREHLPNAISLNTILFQVASVLGPSIGGILIAAMGVGWAYALNAASFLTVIAALLMMRNAPERAPGEGTRISWKSALDGFRFVFRAPLIRGSMLLDFFATFFSSAMALLPIFAQDILQVGPQAYGWLYAASSVGALIAGVLMVRWIERIRRRGLVLFTAVFGYGLATIVFGLSRSYWITFLCLAMVGASDTISTVLRNVIRQLSTPDSLRGRMTSVNMLFFMGGPQLGELEAGLVAQAFGAPLSVVSGGILCIAATGWIAARTPELRKYLR
jgi:MFS family permease